MKLALIAAVLAALCACTQNRPPLSKTDRATVAACTAHANQVYDRLNRATIYSIPQSGVPSSGAVLPSNPSAGLTQRYDYDEMVDRCIRQTGTGAEVNQQGITGKPGR